MVNLRSFFEKICISLSTWPNLFVAAICAFVLWIGKEEDRRQWCGRHLPTNLEFMDSLRSGSSGGRTVAKSSWWSAVCGCFGRDVCVRAQKQREGAFAHAVSSPLKFQAVCAASVLRLNACRGALCLFAGHCQPILAVGFACASPRWRRGKRTRESRTKSSRTLSNRLRPRRTLFVFDFFFSFSFLYLFQFLLGRCAAFHPQFIDFLESSVGANSWLMRTLTRLILISAHVQLTIPS